MEVSDRERVLPFSTMSELEATVGGSGRPETTIKLKIGQSLLCKAKIVVRLSSFDHVVCIAIVQLKLRSSRRRMNFGTAVTATWW